MSGGIFPNFFVLQAAVNTKAGLLLFATESLLDSQYAKQTITPRGKTDNVCHERPSPEIITNLPQPMKSREEALANSVWRLLQHRNFVNESHQLTTWGKVLQRAMTTLGNRNDLQESVFLAIELLRFGVLNANTMFQGFPGSPARGSGE